MVTFLQNTWQDITVILIVGISLYSLIKLKKRKKGACAFKGNSCKCGTNK